MDDLAVLDLLDCPLCSAKLDASARVLPCQHTFCQPCLQKSLNARKELRCPECRTPVYCTIEELPANLLLVRLLEGIRGEQAHVGVNSFRRPGGPPAKGSPRRSRELHGVPPVPYRPSQTNRFPMEGVPWARALCSYRGHPPNELRFNKGDIVVLQRQFDENWYQGTVNGIAGIFPANTVQVVRPLALPPPLCKALYNFELKDKDKGENRHCLAFLKDDIISLIRRVDENWAEGMLGDRIGIFPLLFVECNYAAKQILEPSKFGRPGLQNSRTSSLQKPLPREKSAESAMYPRFPDPRRKGPRQFLITNALNTINKMVHSPTDQRPVEISTPILISSSNPGVVSEGNERADSVSSAPLQVTGSYAASSPQSLGHLTTVTTFLNSQQHISANMCVALHPYKARGPEELDLQKGEGVRILGPFHNGWLSGTSLVNGKTGVFPGSYVIPVFRKAQHLTEPRAPPLTFGTCSSASISSVSSSPSENTIGKYRRSVYVPTAVVAPVRSSVGPALSAQIPLRRGRTSIKKSASLPRYAEPGPLFQMDSTNRQTPSAIVRPQQFQNVQNLEQGGTPLLAVESGVRKNSCPDFAALVGRSAEHRTHSADSSVILDAKVTVAKNGMQQKPPSSAPPSILVKPDTCKSPFEKQVKTVRFQNYSPPPSKRHNSTSSPNAESGRPDQAPMEPPKQEASPGSEMTGVHHQRSNSAPVQMENRRLHSMRTTSLDLTDTPDRFIFPSKISFNEN